MLAPELTVSHSRFLHYMCLLILLLFTKAGFSQSQFGSIHGTIQDPEGEAVPGVSITVSSDLYGNVTYFTDTGGNYRIRSLVPGIYHLEARLPGFTPVQKKNVRVALDTSTVVDFLLVPESVSESITVERESQQIIDPTTTAFSYTVTPEIVRGLPQPPEFRTLMALTPGVGEDLVAYGGNAATSNRIWIDGVDMTSPSNGGIFSSYNYEWIEEVQVIGNGAPAQYGNYAGVIGNFVTRSGGNQFHGSLKAFFFNQDLVGTNSSLPQPDFKSWDVSAQIGGPVKRDRLWFFAGFQYPYIQSVPFGYDGVKTDEFPKSITKLTYKPNESNTIQGFGQYNYWHVDGELASDKVLRDATLLVTCKEASWNGTWISLFTGSTTFESRVGGYWGTCSNLPQNGDIPSHVDVNTQVFSQNAFKKVLADRWRSQANVDLTHYAQDFLGSHDFKFGVQFQHSKIEQEQSINGGFLYYDGVNYQLRYSYLVPTRQFDGDVDQISTYVQDTWSVHRNVSLSLGLRWDRNRGSTDRGVVLATDPVAPRVGMIWKIRENQPLVFKAHFGDYYDAILTRQFVFLSDQTFGAIQERLDGGSPHWQPSPSKHFQHIYLSAPDNKHPFVRQFTVGIDQELPSGIAAGLHYIHRRWHHFLEDVDRDAAFEPLEVINPFTLEPITLYMRLPGIRYTLLTNPDELFRKYDALEIYVNRRFANGLTLSGSFVYSRTRGNIPNSREIFSSGFTEVLNTPNTELNFAGPLVNDPSFAWKFSGLYSPGFGLHFGWFFRHQTGDTWEPLVRIPQAFPQQRYLALPRGYYRMPSQNVLDLRVEKQFAIMRGQFSVTADIYNVFNDDSPTAIEARFPLPNYGKPTAVIEPRKVRLGLRYSF